MRPVALFPSLLMAPLLAVVAAPAARAHDAPTLRVEVRREGAAVRVRVDADATTWALARDAREAAVVRAVVLEDDAGGRLATRVLRDGDAFVVVADPGADPAAGEPLVRLSLFGTDAPGEAVVAVVEADATRLVRVELPGVVRAPPTREASGRARTAPRAGGVDPGSFLLWGVEHVLTGWDHLAFLLTLIVVARGVRDAARVATAFTLAHSATLSLAAFDVVRLPSQPVEVAIALSIVVAAAVNVLRPASRGRTLVAFGFGLVHGLGFSSALGDLLGGAAGARALAVGAFNVGVEAGQAGAIALALPLLLTWRRRAPRGYARLGLPGLSLAAGAAGVAWLVARVAALA